MLRPPILQRLVTATLPADTQLKRLVDRFLSRAGLLVVVFFAVAIGTLNLASLLSNQLLSWLWRA